MSTDTRKSKPKSSGVVALVSVAALMTTLPADAVQSYIATPLGSLGGTYWGVPVSRAYAINAFGHVTGEARIPTTPESSGSHAFIHANGAMIDLGTLGGQLSSGHAINNSGQVTGESDVGHDAVGTIHHAFLYSNGKMADLGTLGGRESRGRGINAMGQVVGSADLADGVTGRAFLYSNGSMTELGTLGGAESGATGINDRSQVIGSANVRDMWWPNGSPISHAFLYFGGVMIDLGTLGGPDSYANGINNAGEVTGWSRLENLNVAHAFLYSGGRMIDLGTLGGTSSYGYAINSHGQVTGESDTADRNVHAFLYTDGKMYDLNSLVTNDLGPGVYLRSAQGINDRGQIAAAGCQVFVVIETVCQAYRLDPIAPPSSANYQGLWWNAPAGSESGWGINFAHQGDTIFATWFTYDGSGEPWWLSMTANRTVSGTYEGTLLRTTGPAFNAIPFDPAKVTRTPAGAGSLTFTDANNGAFSYTLDGVFQVKAVTRQVWGPLPTCTWSSQPNLTAASNYQDLWWVANGAESGWGVNLTHQGDIIFATWFTYDFDGSVLWLSATLPKVDTGLYSGTLERTTGPPFNAQPFDPDRVTRTPVGTLTLKFSDGNTGTFTYAMYGVTQTKAITREVFDPPAATVCSDPPAASVTLDAPTTSPWAGELVQLMAVARDASGYVIPGKAASWASSDPRVASVSSTGVVQAAATGTVAITATIDGASATKSLTVTPVPRISVAVGSTKEVVFRWATDRCEDLDTPDLPAHAVKAEDGSLALFFGNAPRVYVNRGADFSSLKRDCSRPVLASAERPTPESYENLEWIGAVYREGSRWHAFISNEFHDAIAGTCKPGDNTPSNPCWYNSTTYAISTDGARTFVKPMAPAHVVAPPPNVWKAPLPGELPNFEGYGGPFSFVRRGDGFVYGVASVDPSHSEPNSYHPCLIRTDNLGDPASWRAWDGTGFGFRMVSPYILGGPAPICKFVPIPGFLITFNRYLDRFLYLGNFSGTMDGKPACGFYYSLSPDLFHWSPLQLVAAMRDDSVCSFDPQQPGLLEPVPVMYPTVIDHTDTTVNFERPGRTPYLYYVRFNRGTMNDPLYWLDRDLVRVPLTFTRID